MRALASERAGAREVAYVEVCTGSAVAVAVALVQHLPAGELGGVYMFVS